MDRRGFLAALAAVFASPVLPIQGLMRASVISDPTGGTLMFHKDAFAMVMAPLELPARRFYSSAEVAVDMHAEHERCRGLLAEAVDNCQVEG